MWKFFSLLIRYFSKLDGSSKLNFGCLYIDKPKKYTFRENCNLQLHPEVRTQNSDYLASSGFKSRPLGITVYRKKLLETIIIQIELKLNALPCSIIDKETSRSIRYLHWRKDLKNKQNKIGNSIKDVHLFKYMYKTLQFLGFVLRRAI